MCRLLNFIIIDQFKNKRQGSIYFLTHWHSDHYDGISNNWPYGPIYCSHITKRLLLSKYPRLKQFVQELKYNQINLLKVQIVNVFGWKQEIQLKIRIYDSNHMAGSIMILVQYQDRFYLHTGDMRFNSTVGRNLKDLFQPIRRSKIQDQIQYTCKFPIQKLYLDNTFCDPIFMFPPRSYALKLITKIIEQYKPKKVFLCTDSVGKQQAFVYLSKKYNCKIKISRDRLRYIKCMGIDHKKYFTLKDEPNMWIQVIRKAEKQERVSKQKNSISITLTGWANLNDYHPVGYNSFVVPYSLHSNYKQIQLFVKWVRPKQLIPIVYHKEQRQATQFRQRDSLCYVKQRGLQYLIKQYTHGKKYVQKQEQNQNLGNSINLNMLTIQQQKIQDIKKQKFSNRQNKQGLQ